MRSNPDQFARHRARRDRMAETVNDQRVHVSVECYAGYCGEETPVRFRLEDRVVEVKDVLDRWLAPGHRYFRVRAAEGDTYILRHDMSSAEWELTELAGRTDRRAK